MADELSYSGLEDSFHINLNDCDISSSSESESGSEESGQGQGHADSKPASNLIDLDDCDISSSSSSSESPASHKLANSPPIETKTPLTPTKLNTDEDGINFSDSDVTDNFHDTPSKYILETPPPPPSPKTRTNTGSKSDRSNNVMNSSDSDILDTYPLTPLKLSDSVNMDTSNSISVNSNMKSSQSPILKTPSHHSGGGGGGRRLETPNSIDNEFKDLISSPFIASGKRRSKKNKHKLKSKKCSRKHESVGTGRSVNDDSINDGLRSLDDDGGLWGDPTPNPTLDSDSKVDSTKATTHTLEADFSNENDEVKGEGVSNDDDFKAVKCDDELDFEDGVNRDVIENEGDFNVSNIDRDHDHSSGFDNVGIEDEAEVKFDSADAGDYVDQVEPGPEIEIESESKVEVELEPEPELEQEQEQEVQAKVEYVINVESNDDNYQNGDYEDKNDYTCGLDDDSLIGLDYDYNDDGNGEVDTNVDADADIYICSEGGEVGENELFYNFVIDSSVRENDDVDFDGNEEVSVQADCGDDEDDNGDADGGLSNYVYTNNSDADGRGYVQSEDEVGGLDIDLDVNGDVISRDRDNDESEAEAEFKINTSKLTAQNVNNDSGDGDEKETHKEENAEVEVDIFDDNFCFSDDDIDTERDREVELNNAVVNPLEADSNSNSKETNESSSSLTSSSSLKHSPSASLSPSPSHSHSHSQSPQSDKKTTPIPIQLSNPNPTSNSNDSDSDSDDDALLQNGRPTFAPHVTPKKPSLSPFIKAKAKVEHDEREYSYKPSTSITNVKPKPSTSKDSQTDEQLKSFPTFHYNPLTKIYTLPTPHPRNLTPHLPLELYESLYEHQKSGLSWLSNRFFSSNPNCTSNSKSESKTKSKGGGKGKESGSNINDNEDGVISGGAILGDDMGLGKTYTTLAFVCGLFLNNCDDNDNNYESDDDGNSMEDEEREPAGLKNALIIVPATLVQNWVKEARRVLKHFEKSLKQNNVSIEVCEVVSTMASSKRAQILERAMARPMQRRVNGSGNGNGRGGFGVGGRCVVKTIVISTYGLIASPTGGFPSYIPPSASSSSSSSSHPHWNLICLDEGHKIKNPLSLQYLSTLRITSQSQTYRLLLSGTVIQNNLRELGCLVDWVTRGLGFFDDNFGVKCSGLWGRKSKFFQEHFEKVIERGRDSSATPNMVGRSIQRGKELQLVIKPYLLQRLKSEIFADILPPKRELVIWTHISAKQRRLYERHLAGQGVRDLVEGKTFSSLFAISYLKKVCGHPVLVGRQRRDGDNTNANDGNDDSDNDVDYDADGKQTLTSIPIPSLLNDSSKLSVLCSLIVKLKAQNKRTLIFSQSTRMLTIIQYALTSLNVKLSRIDGNTPPNKRQAIVDDFNAPNNNTTTVMLLSTKVGGLGLTLTSASRAIIYDPSWNPADDVQAVDRCYRIGQGKSVCVYRLIAAGTVEERMYEKQVFKDGIRRMILIDKDEDDGGDGENSAKKKSKTSLSNVIGSGGGGQTDRYFDKDELRKLFTLSERGECRLIDSFRNGALECQFDDDDDDDDNSDDGDGDIDGDGDDERVKKKRKVVTNKKFIITHAEVVGVTAHDLMYSTKTQSQKSQTQMQSVASSSSKSNQPIIDVNSITDSLYRTKITATSNKPSSNSSDGMFRREGKATLPPAIMSGKRPQAQQAGRAPFNAPVVVRGENHVVVVELGGKTAKEVLRDKALLKAKERKIREMEALVKTTGVGGGKDDAITVFDDDDYDDDDDDNRENKENVIFDVNAPDDTNAKESKRTEKRIMKDNETPPERIARRLAKERRRHPERFADLTITPPPPPVKQTKTSKTPPPVKNAVSSSSKKPLTPSKQHLHDVELLFSSFLSSANSSTSKLEELSFLLDALDNGTTDKAGKMKVHGRVAVIGRMMGWV